MENLKSVKSVADMFLLPAFTTHPTTNAIQGDSWKICLNSGERSLKSISEVGYERYGSSMMSNMYRFARLYRFKST